MSRVRQDNLGFTDEVAHYKWNRENRSPADGDMIEKYTSEKSDSDFITYRLSDGKSVDIYFSSTHRKLVLISGHKLVTVYDL